MLHIREKGHNLWDLQNGLQSPTTFAFLLAQNRYFLLICKKEKVLNSFEIQDFALFCFLDKWCQRESNLRHTDFQSVALPTELWHQSNFVFASAKVVHFFEMWKLLHKKVMKKLHYPSIAFQPCAFSSISWLSRVIKLQPFSGFVM